MLFNLKNKNNLLYKFLRVLYFEFQKHFPRRIKLKYFHFLLKKKAGEKLHYMRNQREVLLGSAGNGQNFEAGVCEVCQKHIHHFFVRHQLYHNSLKWKLETL